VTQAVPKLPRGRGKAGPRDFPDGREKPSFRCPGEHDIRHNLEAYYPM